MRVPLIGKPYTSKSLIASYQEAINVYGEINDDPQAPAPVTYYSRPGMVQYSVPTNPAKTRCTYRTSLGTAFVVVGPTVYFVASNGAMIFVGSIPDRQSQVIMADNGLAVVLVDGVEGWAIDMATNAFGQIVDASFYGANFVVFLDTFFCFNRPATNQFYISLGMVTFGMLTSTGVSTGTIVGGAAYTNGTYDATPLTGGSGTGATASIVVAGNVVTVVDPESFGQGYIIGDVLSAVLPGGAGFTWTVTGLATAFDPLDIAAKSGSADPIVAISTTHKELWLIGELTTEVWVGTGAADFYFQLQQGAYIDHGCGAQYSPVSMDIFTFWIMQDKQGAAIIVKGANYQVGEISTPAIVSLLKAMTDFTDCVGTVLQMEDHAFVVFSFATDNLTLVYDLKTELWSKWSWLNVEDGSRNRHRIQSAMFVYGLNLIGDWETGTLFKLDANTYTDNNDPIIKTRTFMHMVGNNFERVQYLNFDADMEVGTTSQIDLDEGQELPVVSLSWSDNRGKTYGFPVEQSIGNLGDYLTTVSWNRLGQARDRVFKLEWSAAVKTALNGAFIEMKPNRS